MKRISVVLGLTIILALSALGQTMEKPAKQNSKSEQEVLKLSKEYDEATRRGDSSVLERLLADEYLYISSNGSVFNKADAVNFAKSGEAKLEFGQSDDVRARGFGDTVVVTGRWTARGTNKGKSFSDVDRYTSVYVKRNSRWQIVSDHVSSIPQK